MTQIIRAPATVSSSPIAGTGAWVDYNEVITEDSTFASWVGGGNTTSEYLKCIFDFTSVPPNDSSTLTVIDSIILRITKKASNNSTGEHIKDFYIKLIKSSNVPLGTNFANTTDKWSTIAVESTYNIDSTTIALLSANDIRASGQFGCYIQVKDGAHAGDAYIDYIEMEVNYTSTSLGGDGTDPPFIPVIFNDQIFNSKVLTCEEEINVSIL